jgi:hypothetical protein
MPTNLTFQILELGFCLPWLNINIQFLTNKR